MSIGVSEVTRFIYEDYPGISELSGLGAYPRDSRKMTSWYNIRKGFSGVWIPM